MNQQSRSYVKKVLDAVDAMDVPTYLSFLTDDCQFRLADMPAMVGTAAIVEGLKMTFSSLASVRHTVQEVWEQPGVIVLRGEATYTRKDRVVVTIPFVNVWGMKGDKIASYAVHGDFSPLHAAPAPVAVARAS